MWDHKSRAESGGAAQSLTLRFSLLPVCLHACLLVFQFVSNGSSIRIFRTQSHRSRDPLRSLTTQI